MSLAQHFSCRMARTPGDRPFDLAALPSGGGVYALTDRNDQVVQLSCGGQLRRLVDARLYPPESSENRPRTDLLAITATLWWHPTESTLETLLKFHEIAYRLYPREHLRMCRFGPSWFAVINLEDRFPRWLAGRQPLMGRSACVGPFARRAQCQEFVQHLEELFSLCREHAILEQTPQGQACAYFEMGRCPAPCDGTVPWSDYRRSLDRSVDWVLGRSPDLVTRLRAEMHAASATLEFETAARHRLAIEHAEAAGSALHFRVRRVEDLRYLLVQRCGRRQRVQAFAVNQGTVQMVEAVPLKALDEAVPRWRAAVHDLAFDPGTDTAFVTERIWLVCHQLLLRGRNAGVCLHLSELEDAPTVAQRVRETLTGPRKAAFP